MNIGDLDVTFSPQPDSDDYAEKLGVLVLRRGGIRMPRNRYSVEQIINMMCEADVLLARGLTVLEVCRDFPKAPGVRLVS